MRRSAGVILLFCPRALVMERIVEEERRRELAQKQTGLVYRAADALCCGVRNRACRSYWIMGFVLLFGVGLTLLLIRCGQSQDPCHLNSALWTVVYLSGVFMVAAAVCMFACCAEGCKRGPCCGPICDPSDPHSSKSTTVYVHHLDMAASTGTTEAAVASAKSGKAGEASASAPSPEAPAAHARTFVLE